SDFVVRAEEFGVPQRRHRVIIVGVRSDLASRAWSAEVPATSEKPRSVVDAIGDMPALRSGLSRVHDSASRWHSVVVQAAQSLAQINARGDLKDLEKRFAHIATSLRCDSVPPRSSHHLPADYGRSGDSLKRWLQNSELSALAQHESRGHMEADLSRYLFA